MFIIEPIKLEKRISQRVRFRDSVQYQLKEDHLSKGCLASDLSENGIKINIEDFIPTNVELTIKMQLHEIPKVLDLTGRVIWSQAVPYCERYQIGLAFSHVDPLIKEEIRHYIQSQKA